MSRLRILFAPAAGPAIGGGHLMRALALAQALEARGASCTFVAPSWGESLLQRFATPVPPIRRVETSGDRQAIAAAIDAARPDVLVLDDYSLSAPDVEGLRRPGLRVVVVDDLADRSYDCDLLVDPGFGREAEDYAGLMPPGGEVLAGPRYALLRWEFGAASPRPVADRVARVFVSFGLSDVGEITARAVERLRGCAPEVAFDVALGSDAQSLPRLRALAADDPWLTLHPDARDVAALMRSADAAVGAGGSATWERCAQGLPALAVVVADNQRAMIGRLAQAGAVLRVDVAEPDFDRRLVEAFHQLLDPNVRLSLSRTSHALCDGQGSARMAQAIVALAQR